MSHKIKWIAEKGIYSIDRIEHSETTLPYRGTDGKIVDGVTIPATRIVGFADDVAVIGVTVAGSHSQTLANWRESMARSIQDNGGEWMGRSHASETAKADARVAAMHDPDVTPDAKDRKSLRDAYYGRMPQPSSY